MTIGDCPEWRHGDPAGSSARWSPSRPSSPGSATDIFRLGIFEKEQNRNGENHWNGRTFTNMLYIWLYIYMVIYVYIYIYIWLYIYYITVDIGWHWCVYSMKPVLSRSMCHVRPAWNWSGVTVKVSAVSFSSSSRQAGKICACLGAACAMRGICWEIYLVQACIS